MKTLSATLAFFALLAWGTACQAGIITDAGAADDGDGAVHCTTANWDKDAQTMSIAGYQCWAPGHIGKQTLDNTAYFTAQSEDDPTVTLNTGIDNDTTFAWTSYDVNVYMTKPFTLSSPTVAPDWSVVGTFPISATPIGGGEYEASVSFAGGTPIPIGGELDFGYKLTFIGSVNYCQEMIPVPEPGSLILVIGGLAGLLVVRRRFAR